MIVYPSRWWKRRGFLGKTVTTAFPPLPRGGGGGTVSSPVGGVSPFLSECLDNTPNSTQRGVIMCFVEGRQNRAFFRALPTAAARQAHVAAFLNFTFSAGAPMAAAAVEGATAETPISVTSVTSSTSIASVTSVESVTAGAPISVTSVTSSTSSTSVASVTSVTAEAPISVIEHNWADQPYTRGAYGSFWPPGVLSDFWEAWEAIEVEHTPSPTLHPGLWVAGSDFSARGNGYIDGAIKSGEGVAAQVVSRAAELKRSW